MKCQMCEQTAEFGLIDLLYEAEKYYCPKCFRKALKNIVKNTKRGFN